MESISLNRIRTIDIRQNMRQGKRYFKIDQHLARHFVYYVECLSSPSPFLSNQMITLFCDSMISTNQEKKLEFKPIVKHLFLFYIVISFDKA